MCSFKNICKIGFSSFNILNHILKYYERNLPLLCPFLLLAPRNELLFQQFLIFYAPTVPPITHVQPREVNLSSPSNKRGVQRWVFILQMSNVDHSHHFCHILLTPYMSNELLCTW